MTAIEPCTTYGKRKRHYSANLATDAKGPGRSGPTLCGQDGDDQERVSHWLARSSNRRVTIADLPECKKCARSAGRHAGEKTGNQP